MTRPTLRAARDAFVSVALVLASLTHARAAAPGTQYGFFGDDDPTAEDLQTKLVWQRASAPTSLTFAAAKAYCDALVVNGTVRFRLPTYVELSSLVDEAPRLYSEGGVIRTVYIAYDPFPVTRIDVPYWTSTEAPGDTNSHLVIEFGSSRTGARGAGEMEAVRCVRR